MQMRGGGPVNRVELESQVLCAALRQSWHAKDKVGSFSSVRELSHLFPDLLPPTEGQQSENANKINYYEILDVVPNASAHHILATFLKTVRRLLKGNVGAESKQAYGNLLNAGFILRKPRLRLSHDLVVSRRWLVESQAQQDSKAGAKVPTAAQEIKARSEAIAQQAANASKSAAEAKAADAKKEQEAIAQAQKPIEIQEKMAQGFQALAAGFAENASPPVPPVPAAPVQTVPQPTQPEAAPVFQGQAETGNESFTFNEQDLRKPEAKVSLPRIIELMQAAQILGELEVQALKAQMQLAPNIAVEKLILNAGYVTSQEMNSLKLAETLLNQGKINMSQFQVAMYDERTSGLRMAESLQVRGWLTTEVKNSIEEWHRKSS